MRCCCGGGGRGEIGGVAGRSPKQYVGARPDPGALIDADEEDVLKKLAEHLLSMTTQAIGKATLAGELVEVDCDAKDKVGDSRGGP